ncbi:MAG: glycosyltransferase domain-containing protein [Candidatus Paceibacterota bacterium]
MKVAVYTANFGESEVYTPVAIEMGVDYFYFTDRPVSLEHWIVKTVERRFDNPRLESRYYFDNSTTVLPDYDITIMHGANAQLLISPLSLIDMFIKSDIAAFNHPHRNCIYKEAEVCKGVGKDSADKIDKQIKRYKAAAFPSNYGLHACGLIIRKNTESVQNFESLWWQEVLNGSYRDQLSFDYIRWKTGISISEIPGNIFSSPYIRINLHNRK